jgi:hypothetical protein
VADFEASDLAMVNTADVFEKLHHRLLQFEVGGMAGRLMLGRSKFQNLYDGRRRLEGQSAATDFDTFHMTEAEPLERGDELAFRRQ